MQLIYPLFLCCFEVVVRSRFPHMLSVKSAPSDARLFQHWQPPACADEERRDRESFVELPPVKSYQQLVDHRLFEPVRAQFLSDILELKQLAHSFVNNQYDSALDKFYDKLESPERGVADSLLPLYRETRYQIYRLVGQLRQYDRDGDQSLPGVGSGRDYIALILHECLSGVDMCPAGVHSRFANTWLDLYMACSCGFDGKLCKTRKDLFRSFVHGFMVQQQRNPTRIPVAQDMEVHWFNGLYNLYCENLALAPVSDPLADAYLVGCDLPRFLSAASLSVTDSTILGRIADDWSGQLSDALDSVGCSSWLRQFTDTNEHTAVGIDALINRVFDPINALMGTGDSRPLTLTTVMDCCDDDCFHLMRHREKLLAWLCSHLYPTDSRVFASVSGAPDAYIATIGQIYFWVLCADQPLYVGQQCAWLPDQGTSVQLSHIRSIDFITWPDTTVQALLSQAMRQTADAGDIASFFLHPAIARQLVLLPESIMHELSAQLTEKLVRSGDDFKRKLSQCLHDHFINTTQDVRWPDLGWLSSSPLLGVALSALQSKGQDISRITLRLQSWQISDWSQHHIDKILTPADCRRLFSQAVRLEQVDVICRLLFARHCDGVTDVLSHENHRTPLALLASRGLLQGVEYLLQLADPELETKDINGWAPLHIAAQDGHPLVVRALLGAQTINPNLKGGPGWTALHCAVAGNNTDCVRELLNAPGVAINPASDTGSTPLNLAAWLGLTECVQLLLQKTGVRVNSPCHSGWTAVHNAASCGHLGALKELLSAPEVRVNDKHSLGWTPLLCAVKHGHLECVRALLQVKGIGINISTPDGFTPLNLAGEFHHVECFMALLHAPGVDINQSSDKGWTPLHAAASIPDTLCLKALLSKTDINVNPETDTGNSPLHVVAINGLCEALAILLAVPGIRVNLPSYLGGTPLHYAVLKNNVDCVRQLVATAGIDVNATNPAGYTPLITAAKLGFSECVRVLLESSDLLVNEVAWDNWTALHYAANGGYWECVQLLLEVDGINANARAFDGGLPLSLAVYSGHQKSVALLSAVKGTEVNTIFEGCSSLNRAAQQGYLQIIRLLLKVTDIDVNSVDDQGWTPLHKAVGANHPQCVKALLEAPGIDVNRVTSQGHSALNIAAQRGFCQCLQLLLEVKTIQVNQASCIYGLTALHDAAAKEQLDCLRVLLATPGIDVNKRDPRGCTALNKAASLKSWECVAELVNMPVVDVNLACYFGNTPLHNAVGGNRLRSVQILLSRADIDVNRMTNRQMTPLIFAAGLGYSQCIEQLLKVTTIQVNLFTHHGLTALHVAVRYSHLECLRVLLQAPDIDVNKRNTVGFTALNVAALNGDLDCLRLLLAVPGILVNLASRSGSTPLHSAASKGRIYCVTELLRVPDIDTSRKNLAGLTPAELADRQGNGGCAQVIMHKMGFSCAAC